MKQFWFSLNNHLHESYLNHSYVDGASLWNFMILEQTCSCTVGVNMFGHGQCFYFRSNINNDEYFTHFSYFLVCRIQYVDSVFFHISRFIQEKKLMVNVSIVSGQCDINQDLYFSLAKTSELHIFNNLNYNSKCFNYFVDCP